MPGASSMGQIEKGVDLGVRGAAAAGRSSVINNKRALKERQRRLQRDHAREPLPATAANIRLDPALPG